MEREKNQILYLVIALLQRAGGASGDIQDVSRKKWKV